MKNSEQRAAFKEPAGDVFGTVAYSATWDEDDDQLISPSGMGPVVQLHVRQGEAVSPGQVLATFYFGVEAGDEGDLGWTAVGNGNPDNPEHWRRHRDVAIQALTLGRLQRWLVNDGERVEHGQLVSVVEARAPTTAEYVAQGAQLREELRRQYARQATLETALSALPLGIGNLMFRRARKNSPQE